MMDCEKFVSSVCGDGANFSSAASCFAQMAEACRTRVHRRFVPIYGLHRPGAATISMLFGGGAGADTQLQDPDSCEFEYTPDDLMLEDVVGAAGVGCSAKHLQQPRVLVVAAGKGHDGSPLAMAAKFVLDGVLSEKMFTDEDIAADPLVKFLMHSSCEVDAALAQQSAGTTAPYYMPMSLDAPPPSAAGTASSLHGKQLLREQTAPDLMHVASTNSDDSAAAAPTPTAVGVAVDGGSTLSFTSVISASVAAPPATATVAPIDWSYAFESILRSSAAPPTHGVGAASLGGASRAMMDQFDDGASDIVFTHHFGGEDDDEENEEGRGGRGHASSSAGADGQQSGAKKLTASQARRRRRQILAQQHATNAATSEAAGEKPAAAAAPKRRSPAMAATTAAATPPPLPPQTHAAAAAASPPPPPPPPSAEAAATAMAALAFHQQQMQLAAAAAAAAFPHFPGANPAAAAGLFMHHHHHHHHHHMLMHPVMPLPMNFISAFPLPQFPPAAAAVFPNMIAAVAAAAGAPIMMPPQNHTFHHHHGFMPPQGGSGGPKPQHTRRK